MYEENKMQINLKCLNVQFKGCKMAMISSAAIQSQHTVIYPTSGKDLKIYS